jgi:hypothetical protein
VRHDLKDDRVLFTEVEHVDHVGVPDARGEPRFLEEHLAKGGVFGELRKNHLHRYDPREPELPHLPRGPDLGHPSASDAVDQLVSAKAQSFDGLASFIVPWPGHRRRNAARPR